MTRVELGIQINDQHVQNVKDKVEEPVPFSDQIKAIGYSDLEAFFFEKAEYEMQHVLKNHVYSASPKDAMRMLKWLLQNGRHGVVSVYTDETCVHHGEDNSKYLNADYCRSHNIPIYSYDSFGGNIVATEGDYSFAIFVPVSIGISAKFILGKISVILNDYYKDDSTIEIQGNDLLIDGKKVIGSTSFGDEEKFFFICHCSMSEKDDLIDSICGEPASHKYPGHISTEIITTEELMEEILEWLQGL